MKIITDSNQIDKKKWSDFVKNHPNGSIFQTPEMFDIYSKTLNYSPVINVCMDLRNKTIQGVLLAVIQTEYSGVFGYFSSRSVIIGGPLIINNNSKALNLLLSNYNVFIGKKAIYSQIRNFEIQDWQNEIFIKNGFKFVNHLNIIQNLKIGQDQLWAKFSRSRKKGIKKALKKDFSFHVSRSKDDINEFYKLLTISYKRIKLPFPNKDHFYKISDILGSNNFQVFSLALDKKTVVSMFGLIFNETLYGYYIGTTNNYEILKSKPSDLFFWDVFKWSVDNKISYFDWMGAGEPNKSYGVRDFKLQFGGEVIDMGRYEKIHNSVLFSIGKISLKIWQKLR